VSLGQLSQLRASYYHLALLLGLKVANLTLKNSFFLEIFDRNIQELLIDLDRFEFSISL